MDENVKSGTKAALKFICPRIALILLVTLYAVAGGFMFRHLELTNEQQECKERRDKYMAAENKTIDRMGEIINSFGLPGDSQSAITAFQQQLSSFRDTILKTSYNNTDCSMIGTNNNETQWSLPGAILFSTTVFTTVGYGNIAPKTYWGRLVCMAYALLGIPLMLLTLANIGEIMANIFRYTYLNVCCCGIVKWHKKSSNSIVYNNVQADESLRRTIDQDYLSDSPIDDEDDEELDKISVPIVVTLFLIGSYVVLGAILFSFWINLDWIAAAYFSFITFSTIGFGDIVPPMDDLDKTAGQVKVLGTAFYMVLGMAILSMAFNLMQEEVVEKINWLETKFKTLNNNQQLIEMKNK